MSTIGSKNAPPPYEHVTICEASGAMTLGVSAVLSAFKRLGESIEQPYLVIDMTAVTAIDRSFVNDCAYVNHLLKSERGGAMGLFGIRAPVAEQLATSALASFTVIHSDLHDALDAIGPPRAGAKGASKPLIPETCNYA